LAKQVLNCTVNDEAAEVLVQPWDTLLEALRERMGLTGPKEGCGTGDCGACTIHLDGKPVASCLLLAMQARGRNVRTIEGLGKPGALHPVQDAFVRHGVPQCGFCIPGVVMAAAALLTERRDVLQLDLEDAVPHSEKAAANDRLRVVCHFAQYLCGRLQLIGQADRLSG